MIRQLKNNVTMKKLTIVILFLIFFKISSAPVLSYEIQINSTERIINGYNEILYQDELNGFINHLGFKESQNNWKIINTYNCIGEWQFAPSTLKHMGYGHITAEKFRADSSIFPRELQLDILKTYMKINELSLYRYEKYIGTEINGIPITKAGLLAGMHLGGLGGIKYFLESDGRIDKGDAYGTKISDYIKEFAIYDLSGSYIEYYDPSNFTTSLHKNDKERS